MDAPDHIKGLLQLWWDLFVGQVHPQLDVTMVSLLSNVCFDFVCLIFTIESALVHSLQGSFTVRISQIGRK